jgi:hypothetical protein
MRDCLDLPVKDLLPELVAGRLAEPERRARPRWRSSGRPSGR